MRPRAEAHASPSSRSVSAERRQAEGADALELVLVGWLITLPVAALLAAGGVSVVSLR